MPGAWASGARCATAAVSGSVKTICAVGSNAVNALEVSDWPMSRPLVIRSSWSIVIAWRGSFGSDHAAIGAGPLTSK